jgi:L-asparaginase II
MDEYSLDVVVTRGPTVESRHRVHAAVVGWDDSLVGGARDSGMVTMWRSCAKFFQVLPFLSSGGFDDLGWGEE